MRPDTVGRFELVVGWQRELQRLRSQNESTDHIENFLSRVQKLEGDTVGDMAHHWARIQGDRRPVWFFSLMLTAIIAALLAFACMGMLPAMMTSLVIGALGTYQIHLVSQKEQAFTSELYLRAVHVQNAPVCR